MFLRSRPISRVALLTMKKLHTSEPRFCNRLQISGDTLTAYTSVQKMKPCFRIVVFCRMQKHFLVPFSKRSAQLSTIRNRTYNLCLRSYAEYHQNG